MAAKPTEPELPTREQAREAFTEALTPRQARLRETLDRIADDPPQVLILEAARRANAQAWPCGRRRASTAGRRASAPVLNARPVCKSGPASSRISFFWTDGKEASKSKACANFASSWASRRAGKAGASSFLPKPRRSARKPPTPCSSRWKNPSPTFAFCSSRRNGNACSPRLFHAAGR